MLNIYLIYVSSLETGDVDVSKRVYTNHGKAVEDIDIMIDQYVTDRKSDNNYKVFNKEDFDVKKINKDSTLGIGSYIFCRKKSTVWIYKKVVGDGRIWSGTKLEKVGKIGILSEVNIPVDKKLLRLIKFVQEDIDTHNEVNKPNNMSNENEISEDSDEDCEEDLDNYVTFQAEPSNYEHGQHVSFIQELKMKLEKRRNSIMNFKIPETVIDIGKPNEEHARFIHELGNVKNRLNRITPPSSPNFGLGRVIDNPKDKMFELGPIDEESSELTWDSSDEESEIMITETYVIPELPPLPKLPEEIPVPTVPEYTEYRSDSEDLSDESIVSDSDQEYEIPDDHIEKIVDDIMRMVNSNMIKSSSDMSEIKSTDIKIEPYRKFSL